MATSRLEELLLPDGSLRIMIATLEREGFDPLPAIQAAGVDPHSQTLHRRVAPEQERAFQRAFIRITGYRPDLWLRMGKDYSLATFGQFALILMTAPTLRALLCSPYLERLGFHGLRVLPIIINNRLIGVQFDPSGVEPDLREFALLVSVGCILRLYPELANDDFKFNLICLPNDDPGGKLGEIAQVPVSSNANRTMVLWPDEQSEWPLRNANSVLFHGYTDALSSMISNPRTNGDFKLRVNEAISRNLHEPTLLEIVAASMSMSPRTLQRKLSQAGLKFRDLVDERRREAAIRCLAASDIPLMEIGWSLGYADLSSFTHAFQRWTGSTPSHFRRQLRAFNPHASKVEAGLNGSSPMTNGARAGQADASPASQWDSLLEA